jgi:hypothetical protein
MRIDGVFWEKQKNREVSSFKQKVKQHDNKQRRTAPKKKF